MVFTIELLSSYFRTVDIYLRCRAKQEMVAIAKAIGSDAKIIILDEPTAALLPDEVAVLFGHMRRLAAEGHAFVYVSHRLTEVFEIADRVTVLRDGRRAGTWARAEISRKTIIQAIVGGDKAWSDEIVAQDAATGAVVLAAEGIAGGRVVVSRRRHGALHDRAAAKRRISRQPHFARRDGGDDAQQSADHPAAS